MTTPRFYYNVEIEIELTGAELELMRMCANIHYDSKCKMFFVPGPNAQGNAWMGEFFVQHQTQPEHQLDAKILIFTSFGSLDLSRKILEMGQYVVPASHMPHVFKLRERLREACEHLNAEHRRVNPKAYEP